MKILILTTHLNIGGIAVYISSLAASLVRRGHRVIVLSSGGDMQKQIIRSGASHIKIDIKTKSELSPKLWLKAWRLCSIIKREKPDVIHAHTRVTQVLGYLLSKRFRIPYVSTCHGFFKPRLSRKLFGCWGDRVIAISEAVREHLIRDFGLERKRIELIHNGIDVYRFRYQFPKDQVDCTKRILGLGNENVVGTLGRLSTVKGIDNLIHAYGSSPVLNEKTKLLIVGSGPDEERLKTIVRDLDIEDRVRFVESNLDTPSLLSVMDVFAFPSIQEGLGLSLIEAMASGRPVVATDVGGIRSLVKNNETGLLTRRGDRRALAAAINRLLDDEKLRDKLGSNSKKLVHEEYTVEKMADKTEKLYKDIKI